MLEIKDDNQYGIFMVESPEIGPCQIEIESIGWGITKFTIYFYGEEFFSCEFDFDEKIPEDYENYYFEVPYPYYMDLTIRKPLGKRITEEELKALKNQESKDSVFKRSTLEKTTVYLGMWNSTRMDDVVIKEFDAVLIDKVYHLNPDNFLWGVPRLAKVHIGKIITSFWGDSNDDSTDVKIHVFDESYEHLVQTISDYIQKQIDENQCSIIKLEKSIIKHEKNIDTLVNIKSGLKNSGFAKIPNENERKKKLINPFITELSKCLDEGGLHAMYVAFVCAFGEKSGNGFYKKNREKIKRALKETKKVSGFNSVVVALSIICQMENIKLAKEEIVRFAQLYRAYSVSSDYRARKSAAYLKSLSDSFNDKRIVEKLKPYVSLIVLFK